MNQTEREALANGLRLLTRVADRLFPDMDDTDMAMRKRVLSVWESARALEKPQANELERRALAFCARGLIVLLADRLSPEGLERGIALADELEREDLYFGQRAERVDTSALPYEACVHGVATDAP